MPVSHIGLTVSHLPSSTSFFLSALQSLGYRYIGESGNQIGLGIHDADFFLCQETPGIKAGAAHIAFTAPSRTAVRNFYTAALTAGGRPNGAPATRCDEEGHFNAAVLDLDGNSIEVVYRNGPDVIEDGTVIEHSRVIKWQRSVHESWQSSRSSVSSHTAISKRANSEVMSVAPSVASKASSAASKPASVARSVSEPTVVSQTVSTSNQGDGVAKTIIGTLLGAAAGAAVAYAMVRSEQDSAKKEKDFGAFMDAKNTVKTAVGFLAGASSQPQQPTSDPQPAEPATLHRSVDVESYHSSSQVAPRSVVAPLQIEPAPSSYYAPAPSTAGSSSHAQTLRALEYRNAPSIAPSKARSVRNPTRSVTSPELLTIERSRQLALEAGPESVISVSKSRSHAPSPAPSSFISSFVADEAPRRVNSEGSVASHHSSRSKARSSHSRHSRSSRHEEAIESSPSPPPPEFRSKTSSRAPSKAASLVSSILGRDAKSNASKHDEDFIDDLEIEGVTDDDMDTVVPSDSISQIGSSRKHRSHKSKKHSDGSVVSKASHSSKSSKHSHRSHRSHKSKHDDSDETASHHSSESRSRRHRPSVVSEPSDASTIKPAKKSSRKDSVTQGQYDVLFDHVQYGHGDVSVRGITPSMINAADKNNNKTMVNYGHAQKARMFEE